METEELSPRKDKEGPEGSIGEWWRPAIPPETYEWEQLRRKRSKGGYPWTHLEDEIDPNEYLDDNLYEPVNPPPLHESGSEVISKDKVETGSLDGRKRLEIPPDIEIVNSEGLDGLDQPDPNDFGFDGDREWMPSDDEQLSSASNSKGMFQAGIRDQEVPSEATAARPLTSKAISFDPTTEGEVPEEEPRRATLRAHSRSRSRSPNPAGVPRKSTTTFEILRSKAAGAADQMKAKFGKLALPTRQKFGQGDAAKLARKRPKKKGAATAQEAEADQEIPADEEMQVEGGEEEAEHMVEGEPEDISQADEEPISSCSRESEKERKREEKLRKQKEAEELKKQQEEEKKRIQEEKKREQEEKKRIADEEKKREQEEKKRIQEEKKREAEELKRKKAEEKQKAKEEADRKKAEEKAAKQKLDEEQKKSKLEEQLAKALEAEAKEREKQEELLRQREQEAMMVDEEASGAVAQEGVSQEPEALPETEELAAEPEPEPTSTPTGTGSRRKKVKKTFVQFPSLPKMPDLPKLSDLEFKRKVIKRSKTPPARPTPPKSKKQSLETENQLGAQYAAEIEARERDMADEEAETQPQASSYADEEEKPLPLRRFPETPIFVTQPSIEPSDDGNFQRESSPLVPPTTYQREEPKSQDTPKPQVGTKEKLDKIGQQLKGFGQRSKEAVSTKSKGMGATMKVIGKDLQKFGAKTTEKFQAHIEEIKAKQEAAKARDKEKKEKAKEAEDILQGQEQTNVVPYESATEPRRKFRFKRRDESAEEQDDGMPYHRLESTEQEDEAAGSRSQSREQPKEEEDEETVRRSQLLGRAQRDWESPMDLAQSRDQSEEFHPSSRDSPPGSSLASSTFGGHVRKQGVLQEIDSDEFFLREKGISEGEDEEEINRFLVEELRQAFRMQENALAGFDLPEAPSRPERQPRKPARKEKGDEPSTSYQTFPPEKPRRKAPGYVSDYMKQQQQQEEADKASNQEETGSFTEDLEAFGDDELRIVKEELKNVEDEIHPEDDHHVEFEDDGRYEPISDQPEPVKPQRRKKTKERVPTPLYYNTVAGNEWMRDMEDQVAQHDQDQDTEQRPEEQEENIQIQVSEHQPEEQAAPQEAPQERRQGQDFLDYVDEAGYAVVRKDSEPGTTIQTVPRRKKRASGGSKNGSKSNSLTRQPQGSPTDFSSFPRHGRGASHSAPPSRPQRTYSTLKPRRPPRQRSSQNLKWPRGAEKGEGSRPNTAIGIMQGRPLPPPPRPDRPPSRTNNLDQSSIERAVGARHYANFGDQGDRGVEEPCVATNISLLGRAGDVNIGIQTEPFQEYENEGAVAASMEEDEFIKRRVQREGDSQPTTAPGEPRRAQSASDLPFVFPRRLHLDELEVGVLRVTSHLSASSITVEHLSAPTMEVQSLTSLGPLSVSSIQTQTLNSDQINCNRLASDTVDLPSIVPPSFYNLSSGGGGTDDGKPEGLRHSPSSHKDLDTENLCPYTSFEESEHHGLKSEASFERSLGSPSEELFLSGRPVEFCLTPDQSLDNDDSWTASQGKEGQLETNLSPTTEDDQAQISGQSTDHTEPSLPADSGKKTNKEAEEEAANVPLVKWDGEEPETRKPFRSRSQTPENRPSTKSPIHGFRIAVLENQSSDEKSDDADIDKLLQLAEETPVLSGSLKLEYSRATDSPSELQVHHEMRTESRGSPVPPRVPPQVSRSPVPRSEPPRNLSPSPAPESRTSGPIIATRHSESTIAATVDEPELETPAQQTNLLQMGLHLSVAIYRVFIKGLQAIIDYIDVATTDDPSKAEEQRAHMQVLVCLLLVLIAGILLSSSSGVTFTPPRWEFFMPPPHL